MEGGIRDLSVYRLEKANEDIETAKIMLENKMLKASINAKEFLKTIEEYLKKEIGEIYFKRDK